MLCVPSTRTRIETPSPDCPRSRWPQQQPLSTSGCPTTRSAACIYVPRPGGWHPHPCPPWQAGTWLDLVQQEGSGCYCICAHPAPSRCRRRDAEFIRVAPQRPDCCRVKDVYLPAAPLQGRDPAPALPKGVGEPKYFLAVSQLPPGL